jgi:hypothetical protein
MTDLFNFSFVPVTRPLRFVATELLSQKQWDNVFYQGDLDSDNTDEIRCVAQCPHCFKSWFNIAFRDFDAHKVADLVRNGFLSTEDISNYHIAEIVALGDFVIYKTMLGATAHYVAVVCKRCSTKHLLVMGITEVQPTRYAGALQGIWLVRD